MFSNIQQKFPKNKLFFVILSALLIFVNSTAFADSDDSQRQQENQLSKQCAPRVPQLIQTDPVYAQLFQTLDPQVPQLKELLAAVVDQATYQSLLDLARSIAGGTATGRVLITLPDGTVVVDTSKSDDPSDLTPDVQANSFQHFKNKTVNENHNTRISILDAQLWPCGLGVERKFSTTDNAFEIYLAQRLGPYLNNEGTARFSIKQQ
jgi:hypothetical protein